MNGLARFELYLDKVEKLLTGDGGAERPGALALSKRAVDADLYALGKPLSRQKSRPNNLRLVASAQACATAKVIGN